jgi:hypothetical protein
MLFSRDEVPFPNILNPCSIPQPLPYTFFHITHSPLTHRCECVCVHLEMHICSSTQEIFVE